MRYVYWVIPGRLAGRPGPPKYAWDPAELYAAGIRTVVTASATTRVAPLAPHGIRHLRIWLLPLAFLTWGLDHLVAAQIRPALRFVHAEIAAGRPTLVHCYDGDDRTGLLLSAYMVTYAGMSPAAAVAHVRAHNPRAMKMPGYAAAVRRFAQKGTSY